MLLRITSEGGNSWQKSSIPPFPPTILDPGLEPGFLRGEGENYGDPSQNSKDKRCHFGNINSSDDFLQKLSKFNLITYKPREDYTPLDPPTLAGGLRPSWTPPVATTQIQPNLSKDESCHFGWPLISWLIFAKTIKIQLNKSFQCLLWTFECYYGHIWSGHHNFLTFTAQLQSSTWYVSFLFVCDAGIISVLGACWHYCTILFCNIWLMQWWMVMRLYSVWWWV